MSSKISWNVGWRPPPSERQRSVYGSPLYQAPVQVRGIGAGKD
jgi:hypothetical protein